jgi:MFS family permease
LTSETPMKGENPMRVLPVSLGRSFNGLWFGTGAANLGDGMALFVLPLLAIAVDASAGGVAAVTAALTLAWPVFGLHAGWIVDRVDRRTLLATVNVVRGLLLGGVTAAYLTDVLSLPLILAAAVLLGVAETLVDTALTSTIPLVVEPAGRSRANARIEATINVTNQLAGPPLAGLLAGATLALATGASAALYVLAVGGVLAMTLRRTGSATATAPASAGAGSTGTARGELVAGFRFLWRHPVVRTLTLFTAAMNVVWAVATALLVVYAVEPGPLGLTAAQYGLLLTAMAVGGLLASVLVEPLRRWVGTTRLMIADAVGTVLFVLPVALDAGIWVVAAGAVVAGAGSSIWRILAGTVRQNLSPPELLGRIYSASRMISWGVIPASAAAAGVVAELWSVRTAFVAASVLGVVVLAAFVRFALRTDLESAVRGPSDDAVAAPG